jgi:hypothetical protein
MKLADVCQLCEEYGEHAMSDSKVRRWVRHITEGEMKMSMICGLADHLWLRFGACRRREDSREQIIHHIITFPAFSTNSTVAAS